jgi:hypothetical protein
MQVAAMWQTLSVISSLAYCLVGFWVLTRRPITGLILIGLGISSAAFHWTATSGWQSADVVFIFLTFNAIIANFLYKAFHIPRSILVPSVIVITAIMAHFEPVVNSIIVIGGQFAVLFFITHHFRFEERYVWIFTIALVFNIPHITIFEIGSFWHDLTHSIWHSMTAWGFYKILRIEIALKVPVPGQKLSVIRVQRPDWDRIYARIIDETIRFVIWCKSSIQSTWYRVRGRMGIGRNECKGDRTASS